jgi:hypothetical protein
MHQTAIAVPMATMIIPAICGPPITGGRKIPDRDNSRLGT